VHALDIAPLRNESPPQKRSGIARVLRGFHSFTCTPTGGIPTVSKQWRENITFHGLA